MQASQLTQRLTQTITRTTSKRISSSSPCVVRAGGYEIVHSDKAPKAVGPYSQAIKSGGYVYTCGCVAFNPETMEIVQGGIEAEVEQALKNMGEILKASGSDFSKVVKTTVFLADMADFPKMNAIYGKYFNTPGPARSTVAVKALPKGALFEIDAMAEC